MYTHTAAFFPSSQKLFIHLSHLPAHIYTHTHTHSKKPHLPHATRTLLSLSPSHTGESHCPPIRSRGAIVHACVDIYLHARIIIIMKVGGFFPQAVFFLLLFCAPPRNMESIYSSDVRATRCYRERERERERKTRQRGRGRKGQTVTKTRAGYRERGTTHHHLSGSPTLIERDAAGVRGRDRGYICDGMWKRKIDVPSILGEGFRDGCILFWSERGTV